MPPLYPVSDFLAGAAARGLLVSLDGDNLVLTGAAEARTEKIRTYLRNWKPAIVEHLRQQQEAEAREWQQIVVLGAELDADLRAAVEAEQRDQDDLFAEDEGDEL